MELTCRDESWSALIGEHRRAARCEAFNFLSLRVILQGMRNISRGLSGTNCGRGRRAKRGVPCSTRASVAALRSSKLAAAKDLKIITHPRPDARRNFDYRDVKIPFAINAENFLLALLYIYVAGTKNISERDTSSSPEVSAPGRKPEGVIATACNNVFRLRANLKGCVAGYAYKLFAPHSAKYDE